MCVTSPSGPANPCSTTIPTTPLRCKGRRPSWTFTHPPTGATRLPVWVPEPWDTPSHPIPSHPSSDPHDNATSPDSLSREPTGEAQVFWRVSFFQDPVGHRRAGGRAGHVRPRPRVTCQPSAPPPSQPQARARDLPGGRRSRAPTGTARTEPAGCDRAFSADAARAHLTLNPPRAASSSSGAGARTRRPPRLPLQPLCPSRQPARPRAPAAAHATPLFRRRTRP